MFVAQNPGCTWCFLRRKQNAKGVGRRVPVRLFYSLHRERLDLAPKLRQTVKVYVAVILDAQAVALLMVARSQKEESPNPHLILTP